ncbi:MAG: queuosine precursor transporter [Duodenibacillus sp.]|nr:queuosine precursor transporter [Duodenibacillus sp.]
MKNYLSPTYFAMGLVFTTCLIASNLFGAKLLQIGPLTVSAAILIFPVTYVINDCITEVWGFARARSLIWIALSVNAAFMLLCTLVVYLPPADFWTGQASFEYVFMMAPRLSLASLSAFLIGSLVNAWLMDRLKTKLHGKGFSARAVLSTLIGQSVDSLVFYPIAFFGLIPVSQLAVLMITQVVLKTLYEALTLPVTVRFVRYVRDNEPDVRLDTRWSAAVSSTC